jgi:WD40 repeat protein
MTQATSLTESNEPHVERTFGAARFHTDGDVAALAYDADGSIWSVEDPGVLRQWDESGAQLGRHFLIDLELTWAFSPGAKLIAGGCDEILVWAVDTRCEVARFDVPSWVTALAFDPAGKRLASGHDDGVVRVWDLPSGELLGEFPGDDLPVSAVALDAAGARLASAGEGRTVRVWNLADQSLAQTLTGHTDRIPALAWHPEGKLIVTVGWDATARVWDVATGEPRILLNAHDDQVEACAFAPDGSLLATADSASTVHVWGDLLGAQALHRLPGYAEEVRALAFRPDGQRLAIGGSDRVVHVYHTKTGLLVAGAPADRRHAIAVWSGRGRPILVSNSGPNGLQSWDLATGDELPSPFPPGQYLHVAASADGRWLAAVTPQAEVYLCNEHVQKPLDGPKTAPTFLAFSPDSQMLAAAVTNEGTTWLWNLSTLEPSLLVVEAAEGSSVEAIAFHPDGNRLLCGGIDFMTTSGNSGAVCVWDLAEKKRVTSVPQGATDLAFDPFGRRFAFATPEGPVVLADTDSGETLLELTGNDNDRVTAVAFADRGNVLLAADECGLVRFWDAAVGSLIAARQFSSAVHDVLALGDDRLLAAHANGTASELRLSRLLDDA